MQKIMIAALAIAALATGASAEPTLKAAYKGQFVIGTAMDVAEIKGTDKLSDKLIVREFNAISPENVLKWEKVHPAPGKFDFKLPDAYVAFGRKHKMYIVGHVLLWHQQTPAWVFQDANGNPLDRKALLARLKNHIYKVVGRYKGKIKAWDVVNEALEEDGTMRQTPWLKIIGDDYIAKAFQYAHEADPKAQLTYNDYNIENPGKRAGALALVKKLKEQGVPITTVGIQGHYQLDVPDLQFLDDAIVEFSALGVKVAITELDVDVLPRKDLPPTADISIKLAADPALNPYTAGLPDAVQQQLTERYAAIFAICGKHADAVDRVTLWGVTDAQTWHNGWPIPGRTAYSLLFNRDGSPKPAVAAVIKAAKR